MKNTPQLIIEGLKWNVEDVASDKNAAAFAKRTKDQFWPELSEPDREARLKAVYDACTAEWKRLKGDSGAPTELK